MTLVIATGGIDLSVGAVMAIAGATTAAMTVAGFSLPIVLLSARALASGGIVERHTGSDPQNSAVCRHPDPDGRRARRGATDHLWTDRHI